MVGKNDKLEHKKYEDGSLYLAGLDFMKEVRHLKLTVQERSLDPVHDELLVKMEKGEQVTLKDVRKYKVLGQESEDNLDEWAVAPILVATNREKFDLLEDQARRIAFLKGTHVLRWRCKLGVWKGRPPDMHLPDLIDKDPAFWEYFVKGGSGYVLDNINKDRKLVNGSEFEYHSLVFGTKAEEDSVAYYTSHFKIGSVVTLEKSPASVIVKVKGANKNAHWHERCLEAEDDLNEVLIPIVQGRKDSKWDKVPVRGSRYYAVSQVSTRNRFPLEPGFAFTIHKAQGKTLAKIIVSVSQRTEKVTNLTYAHLYVALSRVKFADDIRLLVNNDKEGKPDICSLLYITTLEPENEIAVFFAGFASTTEQMPKWDEKLVVKEYLI